MMNHWMVALVLKPLLMVGLLAGCEPRPAADTVGMGPDLAEPVTVHERVSGSDAALDRYELTLIDSAEALARLEVSALAALDIDFDQQAVVLFAMGEQPTGGYWVNIIDVQREGDELYVEAAVNRPGDDELVTQALSHPFAAAVIERTDARRLRLDPHELTGEPAPEPHEAYRPR